MIFYIYLIDIAMHIMLHLAYVMSIPGAGMKGKQLRQLRAGLKDVGY